MRREPSRCGRDHGPGRGVPILWNVGRQFDRHPWHEGIGVKPQYDAIRLVISNIRATDDAEAWRAHLAEQGWTVAQGWGADPITAWADRREARTVPTRRTLLQVLRERHPDPEGVTLDRGEAVIDLTYYRAIERK
jgi:hypothetical protein